MPLSAGRLAAAYAASLIVFLVLDAGWITLVVGPLYKTQLGGMVRDKPSLPAAILFYLLYLAGLVLFAVAPGLRAQSWITALLLGGAYGFFTYMTFALTNLAVLRGWTVPVAASDIGWGVVVSAAAAAASCVLVQRLV